MVASTAGSLGDISPTFLLLGTVGGILVLGFAFFVWRRRADNSTPTYQHVAAVVDDSWEDEADDTKKVTVFFGTQTGTAEGFAKVC